MLNKFYLAMGSLLLAGYSLMAFNGWEFGDPTRHMVSAEERAKGGGHASWIIWHSWGFRGGK